MSLRLVFISYGVGVGVVRTSGVKSQNSKRSPSAMESESEESERFHFLSTPLMTPLFTI